MNKEMMAKYKAIISEADESRWFCESSKSERKKALSELSMALRLGLEKPKDIAYYILWDWSYSCNLDQVIDLVTRALSKI